MTTPHMSGRSDAPTPTTHREPSDLLAADGDGMDISALREATNAHQIAAADCREARCRLAAEATPAATLADALDMSESTLRKHAKGECSHRHDTPPVRYADGAWEVADE